MLVEIERVWSGYEYGFAGGIGPDVSADPPELLLGGSVDASFRRAARYGIGWIFGGGTPEQFAAGKANLEDAWREAGRKGAPRAMAGVYFALGQGADTDALCYLGHYYAALGEDIASQTIARAANNADAVRGYLQAFSAAGCDELVLLPCSADPAQVDLLAEAAL
jgi:alkanesulfonate monooxygenase SsuD/methylene tetrahydromethanopterin reductase-like flavin-dependent oxidoreductase (luciferase family)